MSGTWPYAAGCPIWICKLSRSGMRRRSAPPPQSCSVACPAPEISLTELRCLALLQRAAVCDMAPAPDTSAGLAGRDEQQLLDAQQVLALSHGAATGSRLDAIHYQAMHDAVTAAGREETSEAVLAVADKALELHLASRREWHRCCC